MKSHRHFCGLALDEVPHDFTRSGWVCHLRKLAERQMASNPEWSKECLERADAVERATDTEDEP